MNILYRLKKILNTYSDEELKELGLWIDGLTEVESIYIDERNITLITETAEVKINDYIDKENHKK